jgi:hypothetical protein
MTLSPDQGWDDFVVKDGRCRIGTPRWGDAANAAALRPVVGYEGRYEVSADGQVRSVTKARIRFVFPYLRNGYPSVTLRSGGKRNIETVHKLVLEAFKGPRPDGFHGAHLDGDKSNNRVENLAWVSPSENERHKLEHGRDKCGEKSPHSKLTNEQADEVRDLVAGGKSRREVARQFNVAESSVRRIVSGERYNRCASQAKPAAAIAKSAK